MLNYLVYNQSHERMEFSSKISIESKVSLEFRNSFE